MKVDFSKPPKPGHVYIDVTRGVEGPCLCIGNHVGGKRVAGPKPWGGGKITHLFEVEISDILNAINAIKEAEPINMEKEAQP